jgi:hypothetical protein
MNTRTFRIDWLIPVLGIALVGGAYFPMKSYREYQEQIRYGEQSIATWDHLWEMVDLSQIMGQAQAGGCAMTALSLDGLLSASLWTESDQLPPADTNDRVLVEAVARFIDRRRPDSTPMAGGVRAGGSEREVAGQRILTQTLAGASPGE